MPLPRNSAYTRGLLIGLSQPGLEVLSMFKAVRRTVKQLTHNEQTPWESHSLTEDIYFNGSGTGVTVGTAPVIITDNTENLFWQIVTQENNLSFYQKYINRYPYGIYSQQAKASIQN